MSSYRLDALFSVEAPVLNYPGEDLRHQGHLFDKFINVTFDG